MNLTMNVTMNQEDTVPTRKHKDDNAEQELDAQSKRGVLKIFLGMCAGVGKTYAMLHEARELANEGRDVVIGCLYTHGRDDIEELAQGVERIPMLYAHPEDQRKNSASSSAEVSEEESASFDTATEEVAEVNVAAILARMPEVVLVDELAHTNTSGVRHLKRYQDVLELVEAGITVFTTLNVHEVESRADTIREITGLHFQETVPDSIIEEADAVEVVDIAPDELLKRLAEGKIFADPQKVEEAVEGLFRKGNLTALREMALRLTAEHVDQELRDYKQEKNIDAVWKSGERLMVAVGPSPFSEPLVRWTRRTAYSLDASWIALSVQTSKPLDEAAQARLTKNLELAKELGAEILFTTDDDLVSGILRVAREENVSQIVIGKPLRQGLWGRIKEAFSGGSVVDKLIRESGTIDIHVVRVEAVREEKPPRSEQSVFSLKTESGMKDYVATMIIVAFVGLVSFILYESRVISYQVVGVIMLFVTALLSLVFGRGPVFVAALLSAGFWDYFFIPPLLTFAIAKVDDALTLLLYLIIALVSGTLTSRMRVQQQAVRQREERSAALHGLAQDLAAATTQNDVFYAAVQHFAETFGADVVIFLSEENTIPEQKQPWPSGDGTRGVEPDHHMHNTRTTDTPRLNTTAHRMSTFRPTQREEAVAEWVFANRRPAGKFTDTLSTAQAYYVPMLSPRGVEGVIGVRFANAGTLSLEQQTLVQSFVSQITSALEREMLNETAKQAEIIATSERQYSQLVLALHRETTKLTKRLRMLPSFLSVHEQNVKAAHTANELLPLVDAIDRMQSNAALLVQLETKTLMLQPEWIHIQEFLESLCASFEERLQSRSVFVSVAPGTPPIFADKHLLERCMSNLVDNAIQYTPHNAAIECSALLRGARIVIEVSDMGAGVKQAEIQRIFEMLYRSAATEVSEKEGLGIGLTVARRIVEIHRGTITAESRVGGGLKIMITLPYKPYPRM